MVASGEYNIDKWVDLQRAICDRISSLLRGTRAFLPGQLVKIYQVLRQTGLGYRTGLVFSVKSLSKDRLSHLSPEDGGFVLLRDWDNWDLTSYVLITWISI